MSSGSATSDFDSVDNTSAGGVQLLALLLKGLECQCQKKRQLPWSWRQSFLRLFLKWLVSLVSLVSPPLILIVLTTPPRRSQSSMARRPLSHCDQNGKIFAAFSHWEDTLLCSTLLFFFSPAPFFCRRFHDDCFTGHAPGNAISIPAAPDVHNGWAKSKPQLLRGGLRDGWYAGRKGRF